MHRKVEVDYYERMDSSGSARVSPPLSKEEEDQIRRSNKKAKIGELSQGTVVEETQM